MNQYKLVEILETIKECLWDIQHDEVEDYLPDTLTRLDRMIEDFKKELD